MPRHGTKTGNERLIPVPELVEKADAQSRQPASSSWSKCTEYSAGSLSLKPGFSGGTAPRTAARDISLAGQKERLFCIPVNNHRGWSPVLKYRRRTSR